MTHIDPHVPSPDEAQDADRALRALDSADGASIEVRLSGRMDAPAVELPPEARALLLRVLAHLANGDAVTVVPVQAEVTPQQAAEILGVSRPFLVRLLDEGRIAFRMVGTHRRVPLADLLAFKKANKAERRALAAALTEEAQDDGFGYE